MGCTGVLWILGFPSLLYYLCFSYVLQFLLITYSFYRFEYRIAFRWHFPSFSNYYSIYLFTPINLDDSLSSFFKGIYYFHLTRVLRTLLNHVEHDRASSISALPYWVSHVYLSAWC